MENGEDVLRLLCSSMKLERDKGLSELEKTLPTFSPAQRQDLQKNLLNSLNGCQNCWEVKHGSLLGAKVLIVYLEVEDEIDWNFIVTVKESATKLLTDDEARVRLAAGETLGSLCQKIGPSVYEESKDTLFNLIQSNLEKNCPQNDSSFLDQVEGGKLFEKLVKGSNPEKNGFGARQIFQDAAGWKNLETSLKALESMVEGCGVKFQPFIDEELLSLIFQTLTHTNRFIRETGFHVCSCLLKSGNPTIDSEYTESVSAINPVLEYGHQFCKHLAEGLADEWPQVRLSASIAARRFLLSVPNTDTLQLFYPQLLPRVCLNRYYAADGVKIYNQETWKQVAGSAGKELVEKHIESVVDYYKEATLSENHAVREAACACIAELASKISKECVRPFVNILLNSLLNCFQDECWPVRDAACLACGNFVLCFPKESKGVLKWLYPMFYRNLSDAIPSVRQGAACALANVVRAYGKAAFESIFAYIAQSFENVKKQEPESRKSSRLLLESSACEFAKRTADEGSFPRSDKVESCRESQLWESADGCVYLIGELSSVSEIQNEVLLLFPLLKEAARYRHYDNHLVFHETICKQISVLAKNLGKKLFKNVIEEFFDIIFYSLESDNGLTRSAAAQCLSHVAMVLGPNILRGKVRNFNPNYERCLDSLLETHAS